ncbi:DnaJ domain [Geosmithia morbida]|uniref:DnaJ domain n=1 Tax=Geosmithia morbida TaxID=1094350 RepID=A0A9P5D4U5_9HYPO|nr:DnaJ domain [Geosmithia morbida]KAF4121849.1 DnaJ domain [Geosmithia morbida]
MTDIALSVTGSRTRYNLRCLSCLPVPTPAGRPVDMSSPPMDPYAALGVSRDAQVAEIRSAHRKLVLKCHPDKVQDPELKAKKQDEFQRVQQAYEILTDDAKRQKYDDQLRLAELRRLQRETKANMSAPRSSPAAAAAASNAYPDVEIRTAEPRPSSYNSTGAPPGAPPGVRIFTTQSSSAAGAGFSARSWDEGASTTRASSSRYYDAGAKADARPPRREKTAQKKEEKRSKEKQRSKDHKREQESKRRDREPAYVGGVYDEETMPSSSRKSSSKKYDDPTAAPAAAPYTATYGAPVQASKWDYANAYIYSQMQRAAEPAYTHHNTPPRPTAPTPPPMDGGYSRPSDDEDDSDDDSGSIALDDSTDSDDTEIDDHPRRSSAMPRRGSAAAAAAAAEMAPSTPRGEPLHRPSRRGSRGSPPIIFDVSPTQRHTPRFSSSADMGPGPGLGSSPPHLSRTHTMPAPADLPRSHTRPIPTPRRTQTYDHHYYKSAGGADVMPNRGRNRSRREPQVVEEDSLDDSDDVLEYSASSRARRSSGATVIPASTPNIKYGSSGRSGRKNRSPEEGSQTQYHVGHGRTKKVSSSSLRASASAAGMGPEMLSTSASSKKSATYYSVPHRPGSYGREHSGPAYMHVATSPMPPFPSISQSKPLSPRDVAYTRYEAAYPTTRA